MKHSTKYLYGVEPSYFDDMSYPDALDAMEGLSKLVMDFTGPRAKAEPYGSVKYTTYKDRYDAAKKANKHNYDLIEHRKIREELDEGIK